MTSNYYKILYKFSQKYYNRIPECISCSLPSKLFLPLSPPKLFLPLQQSKLFLPLSPPKLFLPLQQSKPFILSPHKFNNFMIIIQFIIPNIFIFFLKKI
jgi:hypothetical protein